LGIFGKWNKGILGDIGDDKWLLNIFTEVPIRCAFQLGMVNMTDQLRTKAIIIDGHQFSKE
jgi:hypothetical protein